MDVEVTDVVFDSRKASPGSLFAAFAGVHQDGRAFIPQALKNGARAVLSDQPAPVPAATLVVVKNPQQALAHIAARFWQYPSRRLLLVGITGTNGKTTTSYLVESILAQAGLEPGLLGTIQYR